MPIKPSVHRRAFAFPATEILIIWSDVTGIRRKSMDGATRSRLPIRHSRLRRWPRSSTRTKRYGRSASGCSPQPVGAKRMSRMDVGFGHRLPAEPSCWIGPTERQMAAFPQARSVAHHTRPLPPRDDPTQPNPPKCAGRGEFRAERHHGHDHGKIVRPGVAAVRAIAASRISACTPAPIQPMAMTQPAVSSDTGTIRPEKIPASGIHHACKFVRLLASPTRHSMRRQARRRVGPESVGTASSRRNRTRSNLPP